MASGLQGRGNGEPRVRRPSEKQQQLNEENISQGQRRATEAENRRRKEAGEVQPRPRSQNVRHEYTSRVVAQPASTQGAFQSLVQNRNMSLTPDVSRPPPRGVPLRAQNIEQTRELRTYARARDSASHSLRERDWTDDEPIVPGQDDDTWQNNLESDWVPGQDDENSSGPVGGAPPMAGGGLDDDRPTGPSNGVAITGNKRARSVTPEGQLIQVRKAKKVSNHGRRLCINDFNSGDRALINSACAYYRCMISTEDAFPSHSKETEFLQRAWKHACADLDEAVQPHPDAVKLILQRGSQMRGEVKSKMRPLIVSTYHFRESQSSKSREFNLKKAAALKEDLNFTYKEITFATPEGNVSKRKGLYQSIIIQKVINITWFARRQDEGVIYSELFHPVPLPTIALVLTAVECGLDEWITGSREDIDFKASDYKKAYEDHVNMLKLFKEKTQEVGILPKIQVKLYRNGRFNSGAQPLAVEQGPKLTTSAILDAIQDWDDQTESEFSDGRDIEEDE